MRTEEHLEKDFFPKLRQKLAEQFEPQQSEAKQIEQRERNFIVRSVINVKNLIENIVAFIVTMMFLIPLWLFKIGLNVMDLIERGIRFVVWFYVKAFILMINFVYKLLAFFKITSAVNLFRHTVKTYLGTYSSQDLIKDEQAVTKLGIDMDKKQHQLIDVKKVQKKIKTPNIFITHDQEPRPTFLAPERERYRERINEDIVPQRTVHENIVQTPHRIKHPHLLGLSQSHLRLKRVSTEPRFMTSASLQIQIPINRQNTSPLSLTQRQQPDRDTSPSFYQKNFQITESSFKKKETPQKQILMLHHHPILQGTQTQKQELQVQLLTLRTKMSQLIEDNNKDIHDLQQWIKEKSETIMMTRKENLELLEQIRSLQKENIKKTKQFSQFEERIKQMETTLEKERNLRNGLNQQVQKLEQDIKVKTIQIMSLKQKIKTNFEHLQNMQYIFGSERHQLQKSPSKEEDITYMRMNSPQNLQELGKSLTIDLVIRQKDDQVQEPLIGNRSEYECSNVKTVGENVNEQEIEEPQKPVLVGSDKQIIQFPPEEETHQTKSTSPLEQHIEQNLEEKIIQEEEIVENMVHKVGQTLKKQEEKLSEFEHEKSTLVEMVLDKPKHFKQPKLMHQQKPEQLLLPKEQDQEKQQGRKDDLKIEETSKKNKKKRKIKNK